MPTYTVKYSNLKLTKKNKDNIAKSITLSHNLTTGANKYFAQIFFEKVAEDNHFMGGKIVKEKQIFLFGQIRSGRSTDVKKSLIKNLKKILVENSKIDDSNIWIYIDELPPEQMVEYGQILPNSGEENIWFQNLSENLQKKLKKIDN